VEVQTRANPNHRPSLREDVPASRVAVQGTTLSGDALSQFFCNTSDEAIGTIYSANLGAVSGTFDAVVLHARMYSASYAGNL
jgi:hypothetical protein